MKSFIKILLLVSLTFLFSCRLTKKVPNGSALLFKQKIKIEYPEKTTAKLEEKELYNFIKQTPNKKLFGFFRFHLLLYNIGFKKIGEEPVLVDNFFTKSSTIQLKNYLNNKGYYNSTVKDTTIFAKNNPKKAKVFYYANVKKPYLIDSINYTIHDPVLNSIIVSNINKSFIKKGEILDINAFEKERDNYTQLLKNNGFYFFSKEYILFYVDSTKNSLKANIQLEIKNPIIQNKDTLTYNYHKRYRINNIYIYPDYSVSSDNDSLQLDTLKINEYIFIYKKSKFIKPKILQQCIFLKKDEYFQIDKVNKTQIQLANLNIFKFINIDFKVCENNSGENYLDCIIHLTPSKFQSITTELEGSHSLGDFGIYGNITYQNKNLFRGAEALDLKLRGGLEMQNTLNNQEKDNLFNTIEIGPEIHYNLKRFLLPFKTDRISKNTMPTTTFSGIYNYQKRPDAYTRNLSRFSFGYSWKESKYKKHIINPLDINFIKIYKEPLFAEKLKQFNDVNIIASYSDHLTSSSIWSFIFNNQDINKPRSFTFFMSNIEFSGNIIGVFNKAFKSKTDSLNRYQIFNIPYAQYIKTDFDYRHYKIFNKFNTIVFRAFVGLGYPYKNSKSMPFSKSYFAGGSTDLRAWRSRNLGPGADNSIYLIDKTGDIKLVGNVEYRFGIYSLLKGAFFIDMGNIWMFNKDEQRPLANFDFNRFYKEFAIGGGFGTRLDFSFFIVRIDASVPFKSPFNNKITLNKIKLDDIIFNLGIGYPF